MLRQWGDRRLAQLEEYCTDYLIISVDRTLCKQWAQIRAQQKNIGRPISTQDAWIAATALRHNLPLVTHNTRDFQNVAMLQLLMPEV